MSDVNFSYLSHFETIMTNLKQGKNSCYYLFDLENAIKLKQLIDLCYIGDNHVCVSFWDKSEKTVAFKVYSGSCLTSDKNKVRLLKSQSQHLEKLFNNSIRFSQSEIEFFHSRNYLKA